MPLSGPAAAARNASLTSCAVALRSSRAVRSTSDTLGVGTRIAMPSSLPAIAGSTSLSALAAPVVVGIIDRAGARARPTQVGVRQVEDLLVVGVRVDRRHQPGHDAEALVQHLGDGRQAVGGARRVR